MFAKQSISKITFLWSIHLVSFIILMPYFLMSLSNIVLEGYTVLFLLGSLFFQVLYMISLILGYSKGDLSFFYPILRGSASLFVPIASVILLGDRLSLMGWIGLLIIFIGILSMSIGDLKLNKKLKISILIAISGGLSITGYTLTDKALLSHMDPLMIIQFHNFIHVIAFMWGAFSSDKLKIEWQLNWKIILIGALFVPGSYVLFLFALQLAQVATLAPMREISIVFGVILGTLFLKEKQGTKKLISAVLIVIGVIILGLFS